MKAGTFILGVIVGVLFSWFATAKNFEGFLSGACCGTAVTMACMTIFAHRLLAEEPKPDYDQTYWWNNGVKPQGEWEDSA